MADGGRSSLKTRKFGDVVCNVERSFHNEGKGFNQIKIGFNSPELEGIYKNNLPKLMVTYDYDTKVIVLRASFVDKTDIELNKIDLTEEVDTEEVNLDEFTFEKISVSIGASVNSRILRACVKLNLDVKDEELFALTIKETHNEKCEIWISSGNSIKGDSILKGFLRLARIPE